MEEIEKLYNVLIDKKLYSKSLEEFEEPRISDSILVSIAAGASRFGLDRNQLSSSSEILDEYSGHSGDPFKTLTRSYP